MPLSLTYTEEKGETPVKTKHKRVLGGLWLFIANRFVPLFQQ